MRHSAATLRGSRLIGGWICFTLVICACAPIMAVRQPSKKDMDVLQKGTPRAEVIAELGSPAATDRDPEGDYCHETYAFEQGYSGWVKGGRATFHLAADVFTLGLWELIGTPTELYFDGTEVTLEVLYDENEQVDSVCVFSGSKAVKTGAIVPSETFREQLKDAREEGDEEPEPLPTDSAKHRLLELRELRESDLITEAEYQKERAEILEQLNAPRP